MCGISGIINFTNPSSEENALLLQKMLQRMHHRGPDNQGIFADAQTGIYLGHNRLSILDLSPAGHQPIFSNSGRYVMTYNGEVYNFQEMKKDLLPHGIVFKGSSDSEVIINYIQVFGIQKTAEKLNGIFAIGVWDIQEKKFFLLRDHLGIKPLYYAQYAGKFVFASELSAIAIDEHFPAQTDVNVLNEYLAFGYIPAPMSIYKNTFKLQAGHYLELSYGSSYSYKIHPYWDLEKVYLNTEKNQVGTYEEEKQKLDQLIERAVKDQMVADVNLGAFLSGGVDSSMVVAMMQKNSAKAIQTFTIGFKDKNFNEAEHAKAVAKHLKTDHTELYVDEQEALDFIPKIANTFAEPFYDSSCIPTFMVSQLAKSKVTVSLSGDGGDEFFCGYSSFQRTIDYHQKINKIPAPIRSLASSALLALYDNHTFYNNRKVRLAKALSAKDFEDFYFNAKKTWVSEYLVTDVKNNHELEFKKHAQLLKNPFNKMMYFDTKYYLPDDILTKVDRTSMAVSLEARVPLLDKRLVEYACTLPLEYKRKNGVGKMILKDVLYQYVPKELIDRPKTGFAIPLESWLKGKLKDWGYTVMENTAKNNMLQHAFLMKEWEAFQKGKSINTQMLWTVLMFQDWCDHKSVKR